MTCFESEKPLEISEVDEYTGRRWQVSTDTFYISNVVVNNMSVLARDISGCTGVEIMWRDGEHLTNETLTFFFAERPTEGQIAHIRRLI
jgi:hypothetical protein